MNKWKLISTGYIGKVFECEKCGYRTVYLGKGKSPTYDCINCFEKETNLTASEKQADKIFMTMAH